MGLLDDAIREHLELKRKHGARGRGAPPPGDRGARSRAARLQRPTRGGRRAGRGRACRGRRRPLPEPVAEPAGWLDDEPGERARSTLRAEAPAPPGARPSRSRAARPRPPELDRRRGAAAGSRPAPAAEAAAPAPERRESDTPTQGFPALSRDDEAARRRATRTCSRRRRTSSRTRLSTTGSGSSRSRRATSTSTTDPRRDFVTRLGDHLPVWTFVHGRKARVAAFEARRPRLLRRPWRVPSKERQDAAKTKPAGSRGGPRPRCLSTFRR